MKFGKLFGVVLMVSLLVSPAISWSAELVIGKNVTPGMPLSEAIKVLGIPESVSVVRGPDEGLDSIEINYAKQGLLIRALSQGSKVEAIELSPQFAGKFASGLKLGDKFPKIVSLYGVPKTVTSQVVRYPEHGLYFLLNQDTLLSAKAFSKDTKLMQHQLMNP